MKVMFYEPDLLYTETGFVTGKGIIVDGSGVIQAICSSSEAGDSVRVPMAGTAMLPGLVNAHSHAFQRLIRGVAEHSGPNGDDFWAWRNTMYHAASSLSSEDMFDVARMTFLEMAMSGITAVGEFHYVHRQENGEAYPDPNELSKSVIAAARSVGIRICLLRVAYERAGYKAQPNPGQRRFYETSEEYLAAAAALLLHVQEINDPCVSMGIAPHSTRAATLEGIRAAASFAQTHALPLHMHVAEQVAELEACKKEHGTTPIALLHQWGILNERTTLVHAIHTSPPEVDAMAEANCTICSCPSTERNLGDGVIDAQDTAQRNIPISLGSDSQATIDLLEDARELDYHLRLVRQKRVLLDKIHEAPIAERLFSYATRAGADSLGLNTGLIKPGKLADFMTLDLKDVSIAGAVNQELLSAIIFGAGRPSMRDVYVGGKPVITGGKHPQQSEIVDKYIEIANRLYRATE